MRLVTNREIEYKASDPFLRTIAIIPKGVSVIPASNLPDYDKFWVEPWDGMSDDAEGWERNYGFLLDANDVEILDD